MMYVWMVYVAAALVGVLFFAKCDNWVARGAGLFIVAWSSIQMVATLLRAISPPG
jgi:hypothetical protein